LTSELSVLKVDNIGGKTTFHSYDLGTSTPSFDPLPPIYNLYYALARSLGFMYSGAAFSGAGLY